MTEVPNKSKKVKYVIERMKVAIVLGIIMIGAIGCRMNYLSKEEVDKEALEKFEEKYGVDYELLYIEVIDDSVENRDEINVYVDEYMEEGEKAIIYSWQEDGKAVSKDNLFGYIIREDYESQVREVVETQYSTVKAYTNFVGVDFDDSLKQGSTLEDAYELGNKVIPFMYIVVVTNDDEETFTDKCEKICSDLKEAKLFGAINIYAVAEQDFEKIERMNYLDIVDIYSRDANGSMPYDAYLGESYK